LEIGWVKSISIATNDALLRFKMEFQGADLQTMTVEGSADDAFQAGALQQDPSGWVQRYTRPNPNSSAGIYLVIAFSGGSQGSAWPYVPTCKWSVWLPVESTQTTAVVSCIAFVIAITDRKAFIQSLRAVLAIKDLEVDKALLVTGPAELGLGWEK
jgi:hypothetical protein